MSAAQSRHDHPNNAPGVPMIFPPWLEHFQIKYIHPVIAPPAKRLPGFTVVGEVDGRPGVDGSYSRNSRSAAITRPGASSGMKWPVGRAWPRTSVAYSRHTLSGS